jgi:hypothetical protein
MESRRKLFRILGTILFSAGILLGMILFIFMNWAYFEASFYFGYSAPADRKLTSLRCPIMMTSAENAQVTMRVTNITARDLPIPIQVELSYFGAATLDKTSYPVAAGQTRDISWTVAPDNLVFGHLVMARVYEFGAFTLPSRTNTCGTVVVPLPGLTGVQFFIIVLAFSLGGMATGWGLWIAGNRPLLGEGIISTRAMTFFTVIVLSGILGGIIGWWGLGLFCAAAGILLMISVVGYYIRGPGLILPETGISDKPAGKENKHGM